MITNYLAKELIPGNIRKMKNQEPKLLFENNFEGIVVLDSNASIMFANKKAQEILGNVDNKLLGEKITNLQLNFLHQDFSDLDMGDFLFNLVLSGKEMPQNYIVGIRKPDRSSTLWIKLNTISYYDEDDGLDKISLHFIEAEDRDEIEHTQILVDEKLKQLIKNSFDMIVLLDSNGIQHFVSESSEKILGYRSEELTNISVIEKMIHPEDQGNVIQEFQNILTKGGIGGAQYRHRHKNGGWVYLEAYGSNQINNPFINAVVLNVRDITERKNVEKRLLENETRLREMNATKDKFFSIIAHDLRSPFNTIVGFSDILAQQIHEKNYEELEKYITILQNSSQLALDLLVNLLEWSRVQTGRIEFNPEYLDLESLIKEVVKLFIEIARQKSINISLELSNNKPVFADKAMLGTILRNLISNGIKFTNSGGEIIISTIDNEDGLLVSVADNGVGIIKEDISKLFRIEESYSTNGTQNEKGTGLGLLICKEFIEKHHGELWVESQEGKGSNFYFSIPNPNL